MTNQEILSEIVILILEHRGCLSRLETVQTPGGIMVTPSIFIIGFNAFTEIEEEARKRRILNGEDK